MMTCFKTASELGHKTVAFPAIGTGILRYPSDLVAATMFESVERFKFYYPDTSLEQVLFVIYPSDDRVLKVCIYVELTSNLCRMTIKGRVMTCFAKICVKHIIHLKLYEYIYL